MKANVVVEIVAHDVATPEAVANNVADREAAANSVAAPEAVLNDATDDVSTVCSACCKYLSIKPKLYVEIMSNSSQTILI